MVAVTSSVPTPLLDFEHFLSLLRHRSVPSTRIGIELDIRCKCCITEKARKHLRAFSDEHRGRYSTGFDEGQYRFLASQPCCGGGLGQESKPARQQAALTTLPRGSAC